MSQCAAANIALATYPFLMQESSPMLLFMQMLSSQYSLPFYHYFPYGSCAHDSGYNEHLED